MENFIVEKVLGRAFYKGNTYINCLGRNAEDNDDYEVHAYAKFPGNGCDFQNDEKVFFSSLDENECEEVWRHMLINTEEEWLRVIESVDNKDLDSVSTYVEEKINVLKGQILIIDKNK